MSSFNFPVVVSRILQQNCASTSSPFLQDLVLVHIRPCEGSRGLPTESFMNQSNCLDAEILPLAKGQASGCLPFNRPTDQQFLLQNFWPKSELSPVNLIVPPCTALAGSAADRSVAFCVASCWQLQKVLITAKENRIYTSVVGSRLWPWPSVVDQRPWMRC